MAKAKDFEKNALVIGILSTLEEEHEMLVKMLEEHFGPILETSKILDFPYTDYYDGEMGGHPVRYFFFFKNLVNPQSLASAKLTTNSIEHSFADSVGRRINIDPGLLSLDNLILATCKDRSHRIPLQDGVYGEVTLIYQNGDFQKLPWTYADYSSDEVRAILRHFRDLYKKTRPQKEPSALCKLS